MPQCGGRKTPKVDVSIIQHSLFIEFSCIQVVDSWSLSDLSIDCQNMVSRKYKVRFPSVLSKKVYASCHLYSSSQQPRNPGFLYLILGRKVTLLARMERILATLLGY
jgi:hypothetical protein